MAASLRGEGELPTQNCQIYIPVAVIACKSEVMPKDWLGLPVFSF